MITANQLLLYYRERYIFLFTNIGLSSIALSIAIVFWKLLPQQQTNIPLHYNIFFGVDYIGHWYEALFYPAVAAIVFLINSSASYLIFHRDKYLAYYLSLMSVLCSLISVLYLIALTTYSA